MKTSFLSKSVMGIVTVALLTLASCAKKDDASTRSANRNGMGAVPSSTTNTCSNPSTMAWGKIFDQSGNYGSSNFENQVKDFVSATLDPDSFGTISGNMNDKTGLDVNLSLPFDSAGNLNISSAQISIKIVDSYVGTPYENTTVQPYYVTFTQAKSGNLNRNTRQINVVFEDSYGSITLTGTYDGTFVNGTVAFANTKSVVGTPKVGTLGAFKTYQCATIK